MGITHIQKRPILAVDYCQFSCESFRYFEALETPVSSFHTKLFVSVDTFAPSDANPLKVESISYQRAGVRRSILVKMQKGFVPKNADFFNINLTRLDLKHDEFFDDCPKKRQKNFSKLCRIAEKTAVACGLNSQRSTIVDARGSKTSYCGLRGSWLFIRVYEKLDEQITRIEFEVKQMGKANFAKLIEALTSIFRLDNLFLFITLKGCEFADSDFIEKPLVLKKTKTHALCDFLKQFITTEEQRYWMYQQLKDDVFANKTEKQQYIYIFAIFEQKAPSYLEEVKEVFDIELKRFDNY